MKPRISTAHSVFQKLVMDFVELEKVYRQHDTKFIELLNSIRNKSVTKEGLDLLNSRYQPDFETERMVISTSI
jgi:hypothetical protein